MLPKLMHFFWDGRMSWLRYLTLATFRQHNPDWTIRLYSPRKPCAEKRWVSNEDADSTYWGPDYREAARSLGVELCSWTVPVPDAAPAQACDLLEWWALSYRGGFFADMDVLWRKPLDPVWRSLRGVDAAFCLESGWLAIGFLAAREGCPLFYDAYHRGISEAERHGISYQHFGTELLYRCASLAPWQLQSDTPGLHAVKRFREQYHNLKIATVPDEVVYPFDWREIDAIFKEDRELPEETVGLHWFGGSEVAQRWNRRLTEHNWPLYRNTLTRCLRGVLK